MYDANTNIVTASKLLDRALEIADSANSDFLSYNEKVDYLNATFRNVYQTIINYNLNVFTVEANLVGSNGVYYLPWDCYQIKSVKNPITGIEIPRRADSESVLGSTYEIRNNTIVIGPTVGPVAITYWRKPFFLSIPNKTMGTQYDSTRENFLSGCVNSILTVENIVGVLPKMYIRNLLADSALELTLDYDPANNYQLGNNFIMVSNSGTYSLYGFNGALLRANVPIDDYSHTVITDDGMRYKWEYTDGKYVIKDLFSDAVVKEIVSDYKEHIRILGLGGDFYITSQPVGVANWPTGVFDGRPAYHSSDKKLHLINPDGSEIVEDLSIPSIGNLIQINYGYVNFEGKLYSNIPDTELNFPNNLYYDCISYDLAVRFLCKMNADSTGVENLNRNAWSQLTASIDQSADFPRVKKVRR